MRKKKIAFLVSHPVQYMAPLFRAISEDPELDLNVIYCSRHGIKPSQDRDFGKEIDWGVDLLSGYTSRFLKNHSLCGSVFNVPFGLINFGVVKEIRQGGYDAIIIHGWHYVTHWLAFFAAILFKVPFYIRSEMPLNQELCKPRWKHIFKRLILKPLFRAADGLLAIGSQNAKFYKYFGVDSKNIFKFPYAVDNQRFLRAKEQLHPDEIVREKEALGVAKDDVVLLFSGKLIKKKRPMDILKAYKNVENDNKALLLLGDGELRPELEDYVKKNNLRKIVFLGFRDQKHMCKYFAVADIFVLPSGLGETWGLVVNEAMCFGLPIIISDMPGSAYDLVRHGKNGYRYVTGDVRALRNHLSRLISSPGLRKKMGAFSEVIIREYDFSIDIAGIKEGFERSLI